MTIQVNQKTYRELINEDIEWLLKQPDTLERRHIEQIVKASENFLYDKVLTCVYCGMEYPQDTPSHGAKILTDHIKVCEKHPMREAEAKIEKLKVALIGLVGFGKKEELLEMEMVLRATIAPDADKTVAINAIHALLSVIESEV